MPPSAGLAPSARSRTSSTSVSRVSKSSDAVTARRGRLHPSRVRAARTPPWMPPPTHGCGSWYTTILISPTEVSINKSWVFSAGLDYVVPSIVMESGRGSGGRSQLIGRARVARRVGRGVQRGRHAQPPCGTVAPAHAAGFCAPPTLTPPPVGVIAETPAGIAWPPRLSSTSCTRTGAGLHRRDLRVTVFPGGRAVGRRRPLARVPGAWPTRGEGFEPRSPGGLTHVMARRPPCLGHAARTWTGPAPGRPRLSPRPRLHQGLDG
jgi:hypothetical protein